MLARVLSCCALLVSLPSLSATAAEKIDLKGKSLFGLYGRPSVLPDAKIEFDTTYFINPKDTKINPYDTKVTVHFFKNETFLGKDFSSQLGLSPSDGFTLYEEKREALTGSEYVYTKPSYQGLPIWGERIVASAKDLTILDGYQFKGIDKDVPSVTPRLTAADALAKAKEIIAGSKVSDFKFGNERSELVIYIQPSDGRAKLSYDVSFFTVVKKDGPRPTRPTLIIDANDGAVLLQREDLAKGQGLGPGGNGRTGPYRYGPNAQFPAFNVAVLGRTCQMKSSAVVTIDMKNEPILDDGHLTPFEFNCFTNTHRPVNGAFAPLNDAHYFAHIVYQMFRDWYGIDLLKELNVPALKMHVHSGFDFPFWLEQGAWFDDGNATYYPRLSIDTVAHEIGHGFTEKHSGLELNTGQAGAINESFSDMLGEVAESYARNGQEPDFLHGANIIIKDDMKAVRYLCDPKLDNGSIDDASAHTENVEVHKAAGVFNKAFCLLSKSPGWSTRNAFVPFLFANKNKLWRQDATFNQAATGVLKTVKDKHMNFDDVIRAFAAVGIRCEASVADPLGFRCDL